MFAEEALEMLKVGVQGVLDPGRKALERVRANGRDRQDQPLRPALGEARAKLLVKVIPPLSWEVLPKRWKG